jgi:hypothetical protein
MTKPKIDMGPPITDEIPGLMDFFATSIASGAIAATGVPESSGSEDFMEYIAEFSYKMARALYAEKYKNHPKH